MLSVSFGLRERAGRRLYLRSRHGCDYGHHSWSHGNRDQPGHERPTDCAGRQWWLLRFPSAAHRDLYRSRHAKRLSTLGVEERIARRPAERAAGDQTPGRVSILDGRRAGRTVHSGGAESRCNTRSDDTCRAGRRPPAERPQLRSARFAHARNHPRRADDRLPQPGDVERGFLPRLRLALRTGHGREHQ